MLNPLYHANEMKSTILVILVVGGAFLHKYPTMEWGSWFNGLSCGFLIAGFGISAVMAWVERRA